MSNNAAGSPNDNISLGMVEFWQFLTEVGQLFNPLFYIDLWFRPAVGENVEDAEQNIMDKFNGRY